MTKRKYFKPISSRITAKKRSYIKARGVYRNKFSSGYRSNNQQRISRIVNSAYTLMQYRQNGYPISNNQLRRSSNAISTANRKSRFKALEVNEKLQKLKKWGHYDTWASNQLISRLSSSKLGLINSNGLIDTNKIRDLNTTQLTNLNKAMNQFLDSKTSTIQGINAVIRKKKKWLIEYTDNAPWVNSLSNKEIEDLYRVFDDEEFKNVSERIKYEVIFNAILETKQNDYTLDDFINEISLYTDSENMNDSDVLDSFTSIYNKYILNK